MVDARSAEEELRELVGLDCWAAGFPNNEDIQLNIGGKESIEGSPRGTTMGTHILSQFESEWEIRDALTGAVLASSGSDAETVRLVLPRLESRIVTIAVDTSSATLAVTFATGVELVAWAGATARDQDEIWEALLPGNRCLVGRKEGIYFGLADESPWA